MLFRLKSPIESVKLMKPWIPSQFQNSRSLSILVLEHQIKVPSAHASVLSRKVTSSRGQSRKPDSSSGLDDITVTHFVVIIFAMILLKFTLSARMWVHCWIPSVQHSDCCVESGTEILVQIINSLKLYILILNLL